MLGAIGNLYINMKVWYLSIQKVHEVENLRKLCLYGEHQHRTSNTPTREMVTVVPSAAPIPIPTVERKMLHK